MTTERLTRQAIRETTASLVSERCSLVDRGYGDELIVGFGTTYPAKPPLVDRLDAPWMLSIRWCAWLLEAREGVIASHATRLGARKMDQLSKLLLDRIVSDVRLTTAPGFGIEIILEGEVKLTARSFAGNGRSHPEDAWELRTPNGKVIRPGQRGLERLSETDPFSADSSERTIAAKEPSPDYGLTPITERALTRVLKDVFSEFGLTTFEATSGGDQGIDLIAQTPEGQMLFVQLSSHHHATSSLRPLLVIVSELETTAEARVTAGVRIVRWSGGDQAPIRDAVASLLP